MNALDRIRTARLLCSAVFCGFTLIAAPHVFAQEPLITPVEDPAMPQELTEAPPAPTPLSPAETAPEIIAPAEITATDSAPAPVAAEASPLTPPPSDSALAVPGASANAEATITATEVSTIPALPITEEPDENLFFDAESLVPTGEMGVKGGPVKVNPRLQPGSKYIVVKMDASPGSRQAQIVSAERAIKLGHYDAALEMYNRLYEKNKRDPNILLGRATALQHSGQTDFAIQAYEELLELKPDNIEAQINMLGLMGKRYPAVALRRLLDLRETHPQNQGIAVQIAVVQAELGQYDDALQYLGIASSIEPNNASHVFNMAVIADRSGAKKEAVQYYERALELDTIYGGGRSVPRESIYERLAAIR